MRGEEMGRYQWQKKQAKDGTSYGRKWKTGKTTYRYKYANGKKTKQFFNKKTKRWKNAKG